MVLSTFFHLLMIFVPARLFLGKLVLKRDEFVPKEMCSLKVRAVLFKIEMQTPFFS